LRGNTTNGHKINSSQESHLDADSGSEWKKPTRAYIDIENVSISSGNGPRSVRHVADSAAKSTTTSSPFASPFSKLLTSTKMLSLVESSTSKLKGVTQYITDKSAEIKDVIMANSSQQEFTYKLKTLSNYQLTTPAYLNGFIKSKTSLTTMSGHEIGSAASSQKRPSAAHSAAADGAGPSRSGGGNNAYGLMPSTQQIDYALEHNAAFDSKFDLEQIPSDEAYKPLPFGWWEVERDGRAGSNYQASFKDVYVDVQISSCN
jgi:hypothetical protein